MSDPYFSVVIPLYNKAEFIAETLQSVLKQKYRKFEIIIVDDGSNDGSGKVINDFVDTRIRYIRQENQGVSAARNLGIEVASGDFVAFLDSDDLWNEFHLSEMVKLIDLFPGALGFSSSYDFKIADDKYQAPRFSATFFTGWKGIVNDYFSASLRDPLVTASTFVVKKEVFNYVGCFSIGHAVSEDLEMWARIAAFGKIAFNNTRTAVYRKDNDNNSRVNYHLDQDFVLLSTLKKIQPPNGCEKSVKKYLAVFTLKCAVRYALSKNNRDARRLYSEYKRLCRAEGFFWLYVIGWLKRLKYGL